MNLRDRNAAAEGYRRFVERRVDHFASSWPADPPMTGWRRALRTAAALRCAIDFALAATGTGLPAVVCGRIVRDVLDRRRGGT